MKAFSLNICCKINSLTLLYLIKRYNIATLASILKENNKSYLTRLPFYLRSIDFNGSNRKETWRSWHVYYRLDAEAICSLLFRWWREPFCELSQCLLPSAICNRLCWFAANFNYLIVNWELKEFHCIKCHPSGLRRFCLVVFLFNVFALFISRLQLRYVPKV